LHAAVKTIIDFETKNDETACSPQFISASSRRGGIKSRFVMQDITRRRLFHTVMPGGVLGNSPYETPAIVLAIRMPVAAIKFSANDKCGDLNTPADQSAPNSGGGQAGVQRTDFDPARCGLRSFRIRTATVAGKGAKGTEAGLSRKVKADAPDEGRRRDSNGERFNASQTTIGPRRPSVPDAASADPRGQRRD
jgi:hypothetical protein